jgi:hypothetical protein
LKLIYKRRNEVECLVDIGKVVEDRRHIIVIFGGVEHDPGEDIFPAERVLI